MLPDEVTKFIGRSIGTVACEVEKGSIKRFADAVDDPNPFYWDEKLAEKSSHGSIIAPPGFFGWPIELPRGMTLQTPAEIVDPPEVAENLRAALAKAGFWRVVDGGREYEFFRSVRAGDVLTAKSFIKDIREREGKTGKMAFMIIETAYHNQSNELAAMARATAIYR
jgi:acyl dehydratase